MSYQTHLICGDIRSRAQRCGRVPREPLPFRSILVASRNDPITTFEQFEAYARDWGSELFDAGAVGHLDSRTGFGAWPDGERLARPLTQPGQP
ncbi:alpha/beta hydrolase [Micromonospora sp. WMMD1082]|uniref:RBBP9/YdeN family alpha/beta hydrolase n=1 Tax=Micromonospora sp. WMMD1082 TaxID=3016104 RepID=UPI003242B3BF